jgi:ADP-L-glycero-D-manno-heptose 6-epimerase
MLVVTGAAGFIGSAYIAQLNLNGITDIIAVDVAGLPHQSALLANKRYLEFLDKHDFIAKLRADTLPAGITTIIHMGACSRTTERNLEYLKETNIDYTKSIIEYSVSKNIRLIYASSAATYGDGAEGYSDDESTIDGYKPLNAYGDSKQAVDLWARDKGYLDKVAALKFFNVYGPNEYFKGDMASIAWKAFNTIKETGSFSLFKSHRPDYKDGEQMRDFVYVKDCCQVMSWLSANRHVNGILNVGSGQARSWNDLLKAIFKAMGREPVIKYIDMPESLRNQYQYYTEAPIEKLRSVGYTQTISTLEDGVYDYIANHLMKPENVW